MWYLLVLFLTVILCGFIIFFIKINNKSLKILLTFSGAFLIGIVFMVLSPEIFSSSLPYVGIFVMIGFLIQLFLELITGGAEHGHEHEHEHHDDEKVSPFLLLIGICIHAFLEGIPLMSEFSKNIQPTLVLGLVIHKIPISIVLMGLFLHYGLSKWKSMMYLSILALMTPIGAIIGKFVVEKFVVIDSMETVFTYTMAIVMGIFLHVSTTILFESNENHKYNLKKFSIIIIGLLTAFGISFLH